MGFFFRLAMVVALSSALVWWYLQSYLHSITVPCSAEKCDFLGTVSFPKDKKLARVYQSSAAGDRFKTFDVPRINLDWNIKSKSRIIIKSNSNHQTILGFGGAFTDAAGINLNSLPKSLRRDLLKSYYGPDGLEYNIGRVPIASTDFSARTYTYDDVENDFDLKHFKLESEDIDHKIPAILEAISLAKDNKQTLYMFASIWSPPTWLKTNKKIVQGRLVGKPGDKYHKTWANYFVRFLQEYEKHGIRFDSLTAENEPMIGLVLPTHFFNSMGMSAEETRDVIKIDLGPALEKAGYGHIKILILDDQRYFLKSWTDTIYNDTEASKYVAGAGIHWYLNKITGPETIANVLAKYPDKFVLSTESCAGYEPWAQPVHLGDWTRGEDYAYDILTTLQYGGVGWVDWNLALDLKGGPNWSGNMVDAPIIVNASGAMFHKQPTYYALAHFTKFIKKGSRILETDNQSGFDTIAAETADGSQVLVVLNRHDKNIEALIADEATNHMIQTTVPARSFQTYLWRV